MPKTFTDEPTKHEEALSLRGYAQLLGYVRRKGFSQTDAADIVQDAYVRWVGAKNFADIRNPVAFLRTATLNLIRDYWRKGSFQTADGESENFLTAPCPNPAPDRIVNSKQEFAVLERALSELPIKRRAALVLYRFENMSHSDIATRLGLSTSMVEKHIRIAMDHCRSRLAEASGSPNEE